MAVGKRLRFEILKRDGFTCRYCGQRYSRKTPAVKLEVDHVIPEALGGSDDAENLITACFDCNRGKGARLLTTIPSTLTDNLEILREKELQLHEYHQFMERIEKRLKKDSSEIAREFRKIFPDYELTNTFKTVSIRTFLQKLPKHEVLDALYKAAAKFPRSPDTATQYFCGICWNIIKGKGRPG